MDLRLVVLGLVDLEISGFEISGFVAAPSKRYSNDKVCHCVKFASDVPDCVSLGFAVTRQTLA